MDFIDGIIRIMESYSTKVPLELFVFIGAFVEEVLAPVPSPIIMTLGGSIAEAQNKPIFYLGLLAIIGAIGKTFGAWILYFIADRAEDVLIGRWGRFFGVTSREIESIDKRFNKGWRDYVFLTLARATPIIPSAPVSVVCGVIKLKLKTYLISTFIGTSFRNILFLYVGYVGVSSYEKIINGIDSIESLIQIIFGIIIVGIIIWAYYKRMKSSKS